MMYMHVPPFYYFTGVCSIERLSRQLSVGIIRALSAPIVRGVEPGITRTCSGVYKGHILVIVSLRVCRRPQQIRSFLK